MYVHKKQNSTASKSCAISSVTLPKTLVDSLYMVVEGSSYIHSITLVILHLKRVLYSPENYILFAIENLSKLFARERCQL
jgi:hypothetical protein